MKILHAVQDYYPSKGGMAEVVKQLSERLSARGHDVTVATLHKNRDFTEWNGVKIREFDVQGNYVTGMTGEVEAYRDLLRQDDFDVISFFAAQQFTTDAALDILPEIKAKKVSVPTGYSNFFNPAYAGYYEKMRAWIRQYDMNVYLAYRYRDVDFARENQVKNICLIPNGADEREFGGSNGGIDIRKKYGIPSDSFLVLHVANYTGKKGHREAIEIFLRSKIRKGTLLMIGGNTSYFRKRSIYKYFRTGLLWLGKKFSAKKVILTEADRATTVAAYKQADLFLFPSTIECSPIVLFEAAAAGTPFLTTDVGNANEIITWTRGGMLLPTHKNSEGLSYAEIRGSAQQLTKLYEDKALREQLGKAGKQNWQEKFTWARIATQYEEMYQKLSGKKT